MNATSVRLHNLLIVFLFKQLYIACQVQVSGDEPEGGARPAKLRFNVGRRVLPRVQPLHASQPFRRA